MNIEKANLLNQKYLVYYKLISIFNQPNLYKLYILNINNLSIRNNLKQASQKMHMSILIQKLSMESGKKLHSNSQFGLNQNFKERYEQDQRIIEAQNRESHDLKATNKELRNTLDELAKANQELSQKINDLEQKHTQLITKIPGELNLDQLSFRHNKHKECIQEALSIISKHQPQFKQKFQELVGYIKSRDQRIEQFEKEITKRDKFLQDQQRHQQMMLEETDYNSKIYEEVMAKSKIIEQQLSVKEKYEAQLIQDKQAEKTKMKMRDNNLKKKKNYSKS